MTIQYLLAAISLQKEAIEKAEAELQKKERNLRELILAQLRGNGLNYGIADAGVVENDRGLWPERPEFFTDKANPRIEITISQEL